MKILITGGTGLIGKALVCELALAKNDITVLSRSPQKVYSHFVMKSPAGLNSTINRILMSLMPSLILLESLLLINVGHPLKNRN